MVDADDEIYYTAPSSRLDETSPTVDEQPPFGPEFKAIGRRLDRLAQAESTLRLALAQAGSASGGRQRRNPWDAVLGVPPPPAGAEAGGEPGGSDGDRGDAEQHGGAGGERHEFGGGAFRPPLSSAAAPSRAGAAGGAEHADVAKFKRQLRAAARAAGGGVGQLFGQHSRGNSGLLQPSDFLVAVRRDAHVPAVAMPDAALLKLFNAIDVTGGATTTAHGGAVELSKVVAWVLADGAPAGRADAPGGGGGGGGEPVTRLQLLLRQQPVRPKPALTKSPAKRPSAEQHQRRGGGGSAPTSRARAAAKADRPAAVQLTIAKAADGAGAALPDRPERAREAKSPDLGPWTSLAPASGPRSLSPQRLAASPVPPVVVLHIRLENGGTRTYVLSKQVTVIGRASRSNSARQVDIDLAPDKSVSREHAEIEQLTDSSHVLRCMGKNRVSVNGEFLTASSGAHLLHNTDVLLIGRASLTFSLVPADAEAALAASQPAAEPRRFEEIMRDTAPAKVVKEPAAPTIAKAKKKRAKKKKPREAHQTTFSLELVNAANEAAVGKQDEISPSSAVSVELPNDPPADSLEADDAPVAPSGSAPEDDPLAETRSEASGNDSSGRLPSDVEFDETAFAEMAEDEDEDSFLAAERIAAIEPGAGAIPWQAPVPDALPSAAPQTPPASTGLAAALLLSREKCYLPQNLVSAAEKLDAMSILHRGSRIKLHKHGGKSKPHMRWFWVAEDSGEIMWGKKPQGPGKENKSAVATGILGSQDSNNLLRMYRDVPEEEEVCSFLLQVLYKRETLNLHLVADSAISARAWLIGISDMLGRLPPVELPPGTIPSSAKVAGTVLKAMGKFKTKSSASLAS